MTFVSMLRTLGLIATASSWAGVPLVAQSVERSLAIGIAVPTGGLGAQRTAGPAVRAAATFGDRHRRNLRLRLELEGAWLVGDGTPAEGSSWSAGTFRAVSGMASLVLGPTDAPALSPYFLVGMGLQRLSVSGVTNPYGLAFGLRGGAGLQWQVGRRTMFAEVTPHAAATDFGTTSDFSLATYIPIMVGIRF